MKQLFSILFFLAAMLSQAQTLGGYQVGSAVQNFTLVNAADGNTISLNNYSDKKVVVLLFTSNECPYSRLYEDRMIKLSQEFSDDGVIFLLINPNAGMNDKNENIAAMRKHIQATKSLFPYLADTTRMIASDYNVTRLPEAFVLKRMENQFILMYKGALDDNPQSPEQVMNKFLFDAIQAMISNKTIKVSSTRPVGCLMKPY